MIRDIRIQELEEELGTMYRQLRFATNETQIRGLKQGISLREMQYKEVSRRNYKPKVEDTGEW